MVNLKRKIVWDNLAKQQLREAYNYIKNDSPQNAEKVRREIVEKVKALAKHPEIYSPDKYRLNNDGSYRAFELHKYRVSYHVSAEKITIVRLRHTKMQPKPY